MKWTYTWLDGLYDYRISMLLLSVHSRHHLPDCIQHVFVFLENHVNTIQEATCLWVMWQTIFSTFRPEFLIHMYTFSELHVYGECDIFHSVCVDLYFWIITWTLLNAQHTHLYDRHSQCFLKYHINTILCSYMSLDILQSEIVVCIPEEPWEHYSSSIYMWVM
jgi:hypothetical protein